MVLALLQEMVADYDEKWGGGKMSAAAYDVAWVAMVREPHNPEQLAFPDSFNWLLRHQSIDGSWGYPPQIVPTLAGLLALLKAPQQTESTRYAAKRAEAHLQTALRQWSVANHESVAFEILVPKHLEELEKLGVVFEFPDKAELLKIYHHKLSICSPELIYSGKSGLIHSLEAFAPSVDFQRLKPLQADNGSYGNSPAATAAILIHHNPEWDTVAFEWLQHLSNQARRTGDPGAMPNAYPIDAFEGSWVLYNLVQSGIDFKEEAFRSVAKKLLIWLQESITQKGASISRLIGIPTDSDDTAMVLAAHNLLADKIGMKTVSVDCLQNFERDTYFTCFELERDISLSANAHVLAALLSMSTPYNWVVKNNSVNKVIDYLYSTKNGAGYWEDKWHQSPFYATATATMALAQHPSPSVRNQLQLTVEWVLATQSAKDGGWGMNGSECSTLEETAYALQILNTVKQKLIEKTRPTTQASISQTIRRGVNYLWQHLDELSSSTEIAGNPRLPRLWRGKELYLPSRVVFSVVLAVLYQVFADEQVVPR
jgi:halimadienyl-diphosphate synthase